MRSGRGYAPGPLGTTMLAMPKQCKRTRLVLLVTGILAVVFVAAVVRYRDELVAWYEMRREFERLRRNER